MIPDTSECVLRVEKVFSGDLSPSGLDLGLRLDNAMAMQCKLVCYSYSVYSQSLDNMTFNVWSKGTTYWISQ